MLTANPLFLRQIVFALAAFGLPRLDIVQADAAIVGIFLTVNDGSSHNSNPANSRDSSSLPRIYCCALKPYEVVIAADIFRGRFYYEATATPIK